MRCYFMTKGHIGAVEFLTAGPDEKLEQVHAHFERCHDGKDRFDGLEVWDGARRVFVYPAETEEQKPRFDRWGTSAALRR